MLTEFLSTQFQLRKFLVLAIQSTILISALCL
nr:MAG TPA: hypothetical protein [Caudoviricetes sp.]